MFTFILRVRLNRSESNDNKNVWYVYVKIQSRLAGIFDIKIYINKNIQRMEEVTSDISISFSL